MSQRKNVKARTKVAEDNRNAVLFARITPELHEKITAIAQNETRSVSAQVFVMLSEWVENYQKKHQ